MSVGDDAVAIVGAGECGVAAAFALRDLGFGGSIKLIGDEPHLPYERPPLSKAVPVLQKPIRDACDYVAAEIELLTGRTVTRIDPATRSLQFRDGNQLRCNKLLLATGARARVLEGLESALTFRSLDDAQAILPKISKGTELVIIGGGFIGLELAACARPLGANVTILEAGARTMARAVPPSISDAVFQRHEREGVQILHDIKVKGICDNEVVCDNGRRFSFDMVVAGTGSSPNTKLAENAGLETSNGVVVDNRFQTSESGVYAAGDCCCFPYQGNAIRLESWRAAQEQGRCVAENILGRQTSYEGAPWLWSDQYDLSLQVVGLATDSKMSVRRPVNAGNGFIECQYDALGHIVYAAGIGTGNTIAKDMRLLEMLITRGAKPEPSVLSDPEANLKTLLKVA